jgi:RNA polymerase sigma factor (sigma-70 family)
VDLPDEIGTSHDDPVQSIILQECLEQLPEEARQIVVARYIENRTLADIGNIHHYSKQGIQNILARSLKTMQEAAITAE